MGLENNKKMSCTSIGSMFPTCACRKMWDSVLCMKVQVPVCETLILLCRNSFLYEIMSSSTHVGNMLQSM